VIWIKPRISGNYRAKGGRLKVLAVSKSAGAFDKIPLMPSDGEQQIGLTRGEFVADAKINTFHAERLFFVSR
jgi:hypothetical protein